MFIAVFFYDKRVLLNFCKICYICKSLHM